MLTRGLSTSGLRVFPPTISRKAPARNLPFSELILQIKFQSQKTDTGDHIAGSGSDICASPRCDAGRLCHGISGEVPPLRFTVSFSKLSSVEKERLHSGLLHWQSFQRTVPVSFAARLVRVRVLAPQKGHGKDTTKTSFFVRVNRRDFIPVIPVVLSTLEFLIPVRAAW